MEKLSLPLWYSFIILNRNIEDTCKNSNMDADTPENLQSLGIRTDIYSKKIWDEYWYLEESTAYDQFEKTLDSLPVLPFLFFLSYKFFYWISRTNCKLQESTIRGV